MINDNASDAAPPQQSSYNLLKRLIKTYVLPYKGLLISALLCSALVAFTTAAIAQMMRPILDDVINGQNEAMIIPVASMFLMAFVIRGGASYASSIYMNKVSQYMIGDLQKHLFRHFLDLDLAFFHKHPSGHLMSLIVNDVNVLRTTVSNMLMGVGRSFLTLIFLIVVMFMQDVILSLAALVIFPIAALFVAYLGKRIRTISKKLQGDVAQLSDKLSKVFQGIRVVKAYAMEGHEKSRASQNIMAVRKMNLKAVRVGQLSTPVNEVLVGLILFGVIIYGGYQAAEGQMTAGQLGAFLSAFIMAYEPMKKLARLNNSIQLGLGACERVFATLDLEPNINNKTYAKPLKQGNSDITFKDVSFQYEDAESLALSDISFTAKSGEVTALVGPSGGGKTTLLNMIPRFYDAADGSITIGDQNIQDIDIASLRGNISLVSQDVTIFDATIAENIAYGNLNASEEDIIAAAKAAAAHDFIMETENGYDTQTGEDGVKLSGGQRQRISIARAILRDAPILLLDEATSALDNESEKAVQDALKALEKGRTTIVIAHRLSTIQDASQIIVIDNGAIAERGTHKELSKTGTLYQNMQNLHQK